MGKICLEAEFYIPYRSIRAGDCVCVCVTKNLFSRFRDNSGDLLIAFIKLPQPTFLVLSLSPSRLNRTELNPL